ncbi:MAG TPA: hypothetical protein VJI75_04610 [Candidatus Nanoarchaeia archaeon]|nr:hypothetical protein [Candidatus Nanoarchaeia archaeon]
MLTLKYVRKVGEFLAQYPARHNFGCMPDIECVNPCPESKERKEIKVEYAIMPAEM